MPEAFVGPAGSTARPGLRRFGDSREFDGLCVHNSRSIPYPAGLWRPTNSPGIGAFIQEREGGSGGKKTFFICDTGWVGGRGGPSGPSKHSGCPGVTESK